MSRLHVLQTAGGDPWTFYASGKQTTHSLIGKQERMANGQLRSWYRTNSTRRTWQLTFDVLERAEKEIILFMAEEVQNLSYQDDLMDSPVAVQIDRESLSFTDLQSDEVIYSATIRLLEV